MLLRAGEKVKKHTDNVNFEVRSTKKKDGGGLQEEEEREEEGGGEEKKRARGFGHKSASKSESARGKYGDESRESRESGDEVRYGDAVRRGLLPGEDQEFNNGYWGRRFRIHVPIVTRPQVITSCISTYI